MSGRRRTVLVAAGFAIGAAFHAADFLRYGWWPYVFGPPLFNLFWNALLPVDLIVVAVLLWRPRIGLPLAAAVIVSDVAINLHAWLILGFPAFAGAVPIQGAFMVFVLYLLARQHADGASTNGISSELPHSVRPEERLSEAEASSRRARAPARTGPVLRDGISAGSMPPRHERSG